jgi:hypothetical protein
MKAKKTQEQKHNTGPLREIGSREAVETAVEQSKELTGTWAEQVRRVRPIRNWRHEKTHHSD